MRDRTGNGESVSHGLFWPNLQNFGSAQGQTVNRSGEHADSRDEEV